MAYLERCIQTFLKVQNLYWIVVEDDQAKNAEVEVLLAGSGLNVLYLDHGPTRCWGNRQRDYALGYIKRQRLKGIVYLADDDNFYDVRLFDEVRKTQRVSIFPAGHLGPSGIERPVVCGGKIIAWHAHWKTRKYPMDMAAFAFNAELLDGLTEPLFHYKGRGGESEFMERIVRSADDLEILCQNCTQCYVWHNQPLEEFVWVSRVKYSLRQLRKKWKGFQR